MRIDIGPSIVTVEIPDFLDPNYAIPIEQPDDICYLSLHDNHDLQVMLDRQDYEWAKKFLWCHTYGSGQMVEHGEGMYVISRPDHIYARRSVPVGGETPSGRPRYGSEFLHRRICEKAFGRPRYKKAIGDHKDGNTLNCRRCNLRWATPRMNARNVPGSKVRKRLLKQMGA